MTQTEDLWNRVKFRQIEHSLEWMAVASTWNSEQEFEEARPWLACLQNLTLPSIPIAVTYIFDLAALITQPHPIVLSTPQNKRFESDWKVYREHIITVHGQITTRFIRRRLTQLSQLNPQVIARFIRYFLQWQSAQLVQSDQFTATRSPELLFDEEALPFLKRMINVSSERSLSNVISPLNSFLLGALCHIESAFDTMSSELIQRCMETPAADLHNPLPPPFYLSTGYHTDESRVNGENVVIHGITKSQRIEKIPEAWPYEFASLKQKLGGKRLFIHKLIEEGLVIKGRRHFAEPKDPGRSLVTFIVNSGDVLNRAETAFYFSKLVRGQKAIGTTSSSMETHGRGLVVDFLRDFGQHVPIQTPQFDIALFLESSEDKQIYQLHEFSLDDLKEVVSRGHYDFLIELETRMPGYFFEQNTKPRESTHPHNFLERVWRRRSYDKTLVTILGSSESIDRAVWDFSDIVSCTDNIDNTWAVCRLGRWPEHSEVTFCNQLDDLRYFAKTQFLSDEELRNQLLTTVLGPSKSSSGNGR